MIRRKKKKYLSSTPEAVAENKSGRDFYATAPNEKWATDVTEFKVPGENKKLYLSAILDLYDRYPVAYVISTRNNNQLVLKTFDKALTANPEAKPLFHSDRGFQYTSKVFQKKLKEHSYLKDIAMVACPFITLLYQFSIFCINLLISSTTKAGLFRVPYLTLINFLFLNIFQISFLFCIIFSIVHFLE